MPARRVADYSTDELLYELLKLTRREQWYADPLLFAQEVFAQHFSKPPASMHAAILRAVTGQASTSEVGESAATMNTTLPFPPPLSAPNLIPMNA